MSFPDWNPQPEKDKRRLYVCIYSVSIARLLCLRSLSERRLGLDPEECEGASSMNFLLTDFSIKATSLGSCMSSKRWEERRLPSSSFPGVGDMIDQKTSGINMYYKENERVVSIKCSVFKEMRHRKYMI